MAPQRKRACGRRGKQRGGDGDLPMPLDVLFDVLLPFPAKELCRLRLVCRAWRSLISDKDFIAAHTRRHPREAALVVVGYVKRRYKDSYPPDSILCDVMDLSGRVARRIRSTGDGIRNDTMVSAHAGLVCVANNVPSNSRSFRLLHPLTGDEHPVPDGLAAEHAAHRHDITHSLTRLAFGQVPSTGDRKVLRVLECSPANATPRQLCEVVTLGSHQWRARKDPPNRLDVGSNVVVIDSIVYFSLYDEQDAAPYYVASFDLETEEWRPTLPGPISSTFVPGNGARRYYSRLKTFSVASLNACLVVVDIKPALTSADRSIDLWFLMDLEKCLWVKQHNIQVDEKPYYAFPNICVRPLFQLDDGRILLLYKIGGNGIIRMYNPRDSTSKVVAEIKRCGEVGLCTESLLSLTTRTIL